MDSWTGHGTLSRLPSEVRTHIYTFVFGEMVANPFYIRKFDADPRWRLCYNPSARVPGILLVSRAIYYETMPVLNQSARRNPPKIVIDYWGAALHAKIFQAESIEARRNFLVRDVATIRPVLQAVENLDLEIKALREDDFCVALVEWIVAVLNARPTRLQTLVVGVHVENGLSQKQARPGLTHQLAKINVCVSMTLWALRRRRRANTEGPPLGEPLKLPALPQSTRNLSEDEAWHALQNSRTHYFVNQFTPVNEVILN